MLDHPQMKYTLRQRENEPEIATDIIFPTITINGHNYGCTPVAMRAIGLGLNLYDASDAEQAHAIDALVGAYIDSCHAVHKGSSEAQDKLKAQSNAVKMVEDVLAPQLRKNPGHKFATGDSLTIADICMAAFYCELTLHDCNRATYSKILMTQEL